MLLALDIGNSSISVGVFSMSDSIPQLHTAFKIASKAYSADEYALLIRDFLTRANLPAQPDCAVLSSVVPEFTDIVAVAAAKLCGQAPMRIDSGIRTGFPIRIRHPEQLGSDIVSNVAAAMTLVQPPFVVLDMGTATTLTVVGADGALLGTIIIPGLKVSMMALSDSAALLSPAALEYNAELIGRDTQMSIRSGVINGSVYMIDGFIRSIREKLIPQSSTNQLSLIATGGLAGQILPHTRNKFTYHENLTLLGEAILYAKNRKSIR